MGYIRHHAIAVTSWNDELIKKAHEKDLIEYSRLKGKLNL